jgi:hypothetical protein
MKIQIASEESLYIEVNGYTIYVDTSIKTEPPYVHYWEEGGLEEDTTYTCEWVAFV